MKTLKDLAEITLGKFIKRNELNEDQAKDLVNNIPSCLITGKRTINGTGIVEVQFDQDYLDDTSNEVVVDIKNSIGREDVENREIIGPCTGGKISESYTGDTDGEISESEELFQARDPIPVISNRKPSKMVSGLLKKKDVKKVVEETIEEEGVGGCEGTPRSKLPTSP